MCMFGYIDFITKTTNCLSMVSLRSGELWDECLGLWTKRLRKEFLVPCARGGFVFRVITPVAMIVLLHNNVAVICYTGWAKSRVTVTLRLTYLLNCHLTVGPPCMLWCFLHF